MSCLFSGGGGIRTPGTVSRTPVFKTGALNQLCHSSGSLYASLLGRVQMYVADFKKQNSFLKKLVPTQKIFLFAYCIRMQKIIN